jgi:O-antigen/teichoic acid export membrane protein
LSDFSRLVNRYYNSKFVKESAILLFSQVITKIFPIICLFLTPAIYSATDFGECGLFLSIAAISASIVNFGLENAIIAAKSAKRRSMLVYLCIISALMLFIIQTIISLVLHLVIGITPYILLIGVYTLLRAISSIVTALAIKHGCITSLSISKIIDSFIYNSLFLIFGFFGFGIAGLIACTFIGILPSILIPLYWCLKDFSFVKPTYNELRQLVKTQARSSYHLTLANLLDSLCQNLHIILLNILFGSGITGQLFLVQRILSAPISVLQLIAHYLLRHLSEHPNPKIIYLNIRYFLLFTTLASLFANMLVFFLFDQAIYITSFNEWKHIIDILKILIPWYLSLYIFKILIPVFLINDKHHMNLAYELWNIVITIGIFLLSYLMSSSMIMTIAALSICKSAITYYFIYQQYKLAIYLGNDKNQI